MKSTKRRFLPLVALSILFALLICFAGYASPQGDYFDPTRREEADATAIPAKRDPIRDIFFSRVRVDLKASVAGKIKLGAVWRTAPLDPGRVARVQFKVHSGLAKDIASINTFEFESPILTMSHNVRYSAEFPAKTRFYAVHVYIDGQFSGVAPGPLQGGARLFNKSGIRYPKHKEAFTNKPIPEADPTWIRTPVPERDRNLRPRYIKWLELLYLYGENMGQPFWAAYQLHHMRPLGFGGPDIWDNCAMIENVIHYKYNTWFSGF